MKEITRINHVGIRVKDLVLTLICLIVIPNSGNAGEELDKFPAFLDAKIEITTLEHSEQPGLLSKFQPVLGFVSGRIIGKAKEQIFFPIASLSSPHITFPLYLVIDSFEEFATQLKPQSKKDDLVVKPHDTKFVRAATYGTDAKGEVVVGGGFVDEDTKRHLILIYVNQASQFTGSTEVGGKPYRYDATLPRAGFHWLTLSEENILVRADDETKVIFDFVLPAEPSEQPIRLIHENREA